MRTDLFDFDLPPERIALRPASPRDAARMLVVQGDGVLRDRSIADLPNWLEPGDQLVVNDTKVIAAQLKGRRIGRETEPKIEATLIKRLDGSRWQALVKPAKKLSPGDRVRFGNEGKVCLLGHLDAEVEAKGDGGRGDAVILVPRPGARPGHCRSRHAAAAALHRLKTHARRPGSRATTRPCLRPMKARSRRPPRGCISRRRWRRRLRGRGVDIHRLTLHVGAGTFLPVKADDTAEHRMHAEWGCISAETAAALNTARAQGGRIVAVGTTSLRLLESAAHEDGTIQPFNGDTSIFITPGYRFRAVDILLTNFHLPRSTLFMLVSAFSGLETMKQAYAHAIADGYRFYSYGDACLLFRGCE